MKEQLITFETAKLAKEKGFDWECNNWWVETLEHKLDIPRSGVEHFPSHEPRILGHKPSGNYHIIHASAPTQSLLETWLFEEHNIRIEITFDDGMWMIYVGEFSFPDSSVYFVDTVKCEGFKDSKNKRLKAIEKGLQEGLKLINPKQ